MKNSIFIIILIISGCSKSNTIDVQNVTDLQFENLRYSDVFVLGGEKDSTAFHFNGLVVNRFGEIYTFDRYSASLLRISAEGEIIGRNGSKGRGPNQFDLEVSGVGIELCGDDLVLAHDMNNPVIQLYDRTLTFLGSRNVNGTIWWISCDENGDYLIHYRNRNATEIFDKDGHLLSGFTLDSATSDMFVAFKHFILTDEFVYATYLMKNELLVIDRKGTLISKTIFPAKTIDENKPATVQTYRSFFYNDDVHVLTAMDGFTSIHVFDSDGNYLRTHKKDEILRNLYQKNPEYVYTLEVDNSILKKLKIDKVEE